MPRNTATVPRDGGEHHLLPTRAVWGNCWPTCPAVTHTEPQRVSRQDFGVPGEGGAWRGDRTAGGDGPSCPDLPGGGFAPATTSPAALVLGGSEPKCLMLAANSPAVLLLDVARPDWAVCKHRAVTGTRGLCVLGPVTHTDPRPRHRYQLSGSECKAFRG